MIALCKFGRKPGRGKGKSTGGLVFVVLGKKGADPLRKGRGRRGSAERAFLPPSRLGKPLY